VTASQQEVVEEAASSQIFPPGVLTRILRSWAIVSNHRNPGSALAGAVELMSTGGSGCGIDEVISIQRASVSPFKKPQIFKISSSVSYHNAPWRGFLGAAALKYTGAEVDVGTLTASHCTPVHFQDLPLNVYTWPRAGFDGKLYAINQ
jgi:hypothetical protein